MSRRFHIGIDVGGTNTDAAVLRRGTVDANDPDKGLVASFKTQTTPDVTDGIALAIEQVLRAGGISASEIAAVSVGTTHFVNAVIECDPRRLAKVAVIRLAYPYTQQCPPFTDFPPRLRKLMEGHTAILHGGLQVDGSEISPIRRDEIVRECENIKRKSIRNIVVVGVFSPVAQDQSQEHATKEIILETLGSGNVNVVCSSDVGSIGLLERENAAILNASMLSFAQRTIRSYRAVVTRLGIKCPLLLTQFDGTMLAASKAVEIPVRTFSNGPTNSMRGAGYLSGSGRESSKTWIVVDVGGTTCDAGVLLPSGFPRQAAAYTEIGGIRTNFSMPDISSIGLGGGSRVRFHQDGRVTVGPDSVGNALLTSAISFGGTELTTTDIAFAAGLCKPFANANVAQVTAQLSPTQISRAVEEIRRKFSGLVDKIKTSSEDADVLLVGGGSVIIPDDLPGIARLVRPAHHDVANAVGAAVARVAGEVSCVEVLLNRALSDVLEPIKQRAIKAAEDLGAKKGEIQVAEVSCVQLPYVSNRATRILVRAVGDLDPDASFPEDSEATPAGAEAQDEQAEASAQVSAFQPEGTTTFDVNAYKPAVTADGVWTISETDLEFLADGCAVLGCGGGGSPYPAFLQAREVLRAGGRMRVVDDAYFKDDTALLMPCGFMGSPSVSSERLPAGNEITSAAVELFKFMGITKVDGILSDEIGGGNGIEPMIVASSKNLDIPLVDGDLMGRAYPHMHQVLPCAFVEGILCPCAVSDGAGNTTIVPTASRNSNVENILRAVCETLGSKVGGCMRPLSVSEFRKYGITRSTSQAWRIGRAIALCRQQKRIRHIAEAILAVQNGKQLFMGKIVEVTREVRGGFTFGELHIAGLRKDEIESADDEVHIADATLVIPFQNENLAAIRRGAGSEQVLCTVPDLIAVLDSQSGAAIGTQDYRYGLRVTVIAMAGHPQWKTSQGLAVGGPATFLIDTPYTSIASYKEPLSVIYEYKSSRKEGPGLSGHHT